MCLHQAYILYPGTHLEHEQDEARDWCPTTDTEHEQDGMLDVEEAIKDILWFVKLL